MSRGIRLGRRGRQLFIPVAVVTALLLTACWPQVGANGGHTRYNAVESKLTAANVDTLQEVWRAENRADLTEPIVRKGRVYLTYTTRTATGVQAYDVATGVTLWDQRLQHRDVSLQWSPNVRGTPPAFVGDELWSGHRAVSPSDPEGPVCDIGTDVLDPATGARTTVDTGFPSSQVSSGPAVVRVMQRFTGEPCDSESSWTLEVENQQPDGPVSHWTAPLERSPQDVVVGDNHVYVLRLKTATPLGPVFEVAAYATRGCGADPCSAAWTLDVPGPVKELVAEPWGPLYMLIGDNLVAHDQVTGTLLWAGELAGSAVGMAVGRGSVFVLSSPRTNDGVSLGAIEAFSTWGCVFWISCPPTWSASLPNTSTTAPVVAGDVLYSVDEEGLVAFPADGCWATTCDPLVGVPIEMPPGSVPELSVAQGHVFVSVDGSDDVVGPGEGGQLIAFAPDG